MGWFCHDVPVGHPSFGKAFRCTCNGDFSRFCGLNEAERTLTVNELRGSAPAVVALRYLIPMLIENPEGMLTLWGRYGTGKTVAAQTVIAGLVRAKRNARFIHAKALEQLWFNDMHNDTASARSYRDVPFLAIDELDKVNLKSDWVKQQFQELLDYRYRLAVSGTQLTIITLQSDPREALPGDIASRLHDGRFYREWTGGTHPMVIERWDQRVLPGVLHVDGPDVRPYIPPEFARTPPQNGSNGGGPR